VIGDRLRRPVAHQGEYSWQLASRLPGLYFTTKVTIAWRARARVSAQAGGLLALARAHDAAETIARRFSPLQFQDAQDRINADLLTLAGTTANGVRIDQATVRIDLDERTQRTARTRETQAHAPGAADQDPSTTVGSVKEFRDELLADPAIAWTYWFLHHHDKLTAKPTDLGEFVGHLAEFDNNSAWITAARLLQTFVEELPRDLRVDLLKNIHKIMTSYDRADLARQIVFPDYQDPAHIPGRTQTNGASEAP
jgi:hypothetical protein